METAVAACLDKLQAILQEGEEKSQFSAKDELTNLSNFITANNERNLDEQASICTKILGDGKMSGLLSFIDHRPFDLSGTKEARWEPSIQQQGFQVLAEVLGRLSALNCLLYNQNAMKLAWDICEYTVCHDSKSASLKESAAESVIIVLRGLGRNDIVDEENIVSTAKKLLKKFIFSKKTGVEASVAVRRNVLRIMGIISRKHAEAFNRREFDARSMPVAFLDCLQKQMRASKGQKKENQVVAGCLEAMSDFLHAFEGLVRDQRGAISELYEVTCESIGDAVGQDKVSRYDLPKAAIKVLTEHCGLFSEFFYNQNCPPTDVLNNLLSVCQSKNNEFRRNGLAALDAWMACLRRDLHEHQDQYCALMNRFGELLDSNERSTDKLMAIKGFGALSQTMRKLDKVNLLDKLWFKLASIVEKMLATDENKPADQEDRVDLPDLVTAFADILLEMPQVSNEAVDVLDKLLDALFKSYAGVPSSRQFLHGRAWYYLLFSLKDKKGFALKHVLDRTIFRGLVISIEPSTDDKAAPPGVFPEPNQRPQPCVKYAQLWRSLQEQISTEWLHLRVEACRLDAGSPSDRLERHVYQHMFEAVVNILEKLDFSVEIPDEPQDAEQPGGTDVCPDSVSTVIAQAAGMNGRERPRCQKDFDIFLNLVQFLQLVMKNLPSIFFRDSYVQVCKSLVRLSSEHPLISGFFKLLSLSMRIIENGDFFRGNTQADAMDIDDGAAGPQSDAELCKNLVGKFAREVVARTEQIFDELLAACLEFLLALPSQMLDFQVQIPALKGALKMGVSVPSMAVLALESLELFVERYSKNLRPYLAEVLPLLNDYLVHHDPEGDDEGDREVESIDKKRRRAQYQLKKNTERGRRQFFKAATGAGERDIAVRTMRLLGSLGSDNVWLVEGAGDSAGEEGRLDTTMNLLPFRIDVKGQEFDIILDSVLPRIVYLAERSADRKVKVAACEVLHSIIILSVGKHTQCPDDSTPGKRADTLKKFDSLFRFLFPVIFRLAVSVEIVTEQLFLELARQIIRWYTSKTGDRFRIETEILLDAIMGAIESASDAKLRGKAAEFLFLYVTWTLKTLTDARKGEEATSIKALLRRLYGLMNHPNVCKRLGAFLAVQQLSQKGNGLVRHDKVVDQFFFELLHNTIISLKFCDRDDPALETPRAGLKAVYGLVENVLFANKEKHLEMLVLERKKLSDETLNPRRLHTDLADFVQWLFYEIKSPEKTCRRFCMELFQRICNKVPECPTPESWVRKHVLEDPDTDLASIFEDAALCTMDLNSSLGAVSNSLLHLTTILDVYQWLLNAAYVVPKHVFLESSKLLEAVEKFLNNCALCKLSTKITKISTPAELLRYQFEKSKCMYALMKFVATLLERFPNFKMPRELVGEKLFEAVFSCLLVPTSIDLDVTRDLIVTVEIPKQVENNLLPSLGRSKKHYDSAKAVLRRMTDRSDICLHGFDVRKCSFNSDELRVFFEGYKLFGRTGILSGLVQSDQGKELLLSVWGTDLKTTSPADKLVKKKILELSFQLHSDPSLAWNLIFDSNISATEQWRDSKGWTFYMFFRDCLDPFFRSQLSRLCEHCDILPKASSTEWLAALLQQLLEGLNGNDAKDVLDAIFHMPEGRTLENLWFIKLASFKDTNYYRRKQAVSIIHRIVTACPECPSDHHIGPILCEALCCVLTDPSRDDNERTDYIDDFNLFKVKADAFSLLPPLLDGSSPPDVDKVVKAASIVLENTFPANSKELQKGSDSFQRFDLLFKALISATRRCTTPGILPLLKDYVIREEDHAFADALNDTLDVYLLSLSENHAVRVAEEITIAIRENAAQDEVSLQVQRGMVQRVCIRMLSSMEETTLLDFFVSHHGLFLDVMRDMTMTPPGLNKKVCVMGILQVLYRNLDYTGANSISERVHTAFDPSGEKTKLTVEFIKYLKKMRAVQNTFSTITFRTQSKIELFESWMFKEVEWNKIIDTSEKLTFKVADRFKQSSDALMTFRQKKESRRQRAAGGSFGTGTLNSMLDSQFGSLTQDIQALPTLFGFNQSASTLSRERMIISDGSEMVLEDDPINTNECMRPMLALIQTMQKKFPANRRPDGTYEIPGWINTLKNVLEDRDQWCEENDLIRNKNLNVRLFVAKLLINNNQLVTERAKSSKGAKDVFQSFASCFFEAFFHEKCGIALIVSSPEENGGNLWDCFNYFVRDICLLWMNWLKDDVAGAEYRLRDEHRDMAWNFVNRLMAIAGHDERPVMKSNVEFLGWFVEKWRPFAQADHLNTCMNTIKWFTKKTLVKKATEKDEKDWRRWVTCGMQLLLVFINVEQEMIENQSNGDALVYLPFDKLKDFFDDVLKLVKPVDHKNVVNRGHGSTKLLIPASSTCGEILSLMKTLPDTWSDSGRNQVRDELANTFLEVVAKFEKRDQLLYALNSIVEAYPAIAEIDGCFEQAQTHLNQTQGSFYHICQSIFIAYVARLHLWDASEEQDKKFTDLNRMLLPILPKMLTKLDPKTQLLALRLLTGRETDGSRLPVRKSDGTEFPGTIRNAGLLSKMTSTQISNFWHNIKNDIFIDHSSEHCRLHFFLLVQDLLALDITGVKEERLEQYLVPGLTDPSDKVIETVFSWWHSDFLPMDARERVLKMLDTMREDARPGASTSHWLGSAAWLMLELCRSNGQKLLFETALQESATFHKQVIRTSQQGGGSLPMTPMFASGSLPISSSMMGSQFNPYSQIPAGDDAGGVLATMAFDDDSSMSIDDSSGADGFLAMQTQQAYQNVGSNIVYPAKRRAGGAFKPVVTTVSLATGPGKAEVHRPRGAFAVPKPKMRFITKAGSSEEANKRKYSRITEENQQALARSKLARAQQVQIKREYRTGEVPDIQIKRDDIVKTLQRVALRDSGFAKVMVVRLYCAMAKSTPDNESTQDYETNKEDIRKAVVKMLEYVVGKAATGTEDATGAGGVEGFVSADLVETVLGIANIEEMTLPANLIAVASEKCFTFYSGIQALERQALRAESAAVSGAADVPEKQKKKRSLPTPKNRQQLAAEREMKDDDWVQLSKLYSKLEEKDIVLGLCEKVSKHRGTRRALEAELQGNFVEAADLYQELLADYNDVEAGNKTWDENMSPSDVEIDQWNNGVTACLRGSLLWSQLTDWLVDVVADVDENASHTERMTAFQQNVWKDANWRHLQQHLRCLVGLCEGSENCADSQSDLVQLVGECFHDKALSGRRRKLESLFLHETALALLLSKDNNLHLAKELVKKGMVNFLEGWSSSGSIGRVAQRNRLRSLQQLVELEEYITAAENELPSFKAVIDTWDTRLPSQYGEDADSWDYILNSRIALMSRIPADLDIDRKAVKAKLYLSMSKVARRQGALQVADVFWKKAKDSGANSVQCVMSGMKLLLADFVAKGSGEKLQKAMDMCQETTGSQLQPVKLLSLRAKVLDLRLTNSASDGQRGERRDEVFNGYLDALKGTTGFAKVRLQLALFCDQEISQSVDSARWGTKSHSRALYVHTYVESLLSAMKMGSAMARAHFPRVLDLLKKEYAHAERAFQEGMIQVPAWMLLGWLPQLCAMISTANLMPYADAVVGVLVRIAKEYPQTVFYSFRVVKPDLQAVHREKLSAALRTSEGGLEAFCRALSHLQFPRKQIIDFLANVMVPQLKGKDSLDDKSYDCLAKQYKEVYEDCMDTHSKTVGDFRTKAAKGLCSACGNVLGANGVLKKTLKGADVDKVLKELKDVERKDSTIQKKSILLAHLSKTLKEYEGRVSEQDVCVPGQQLREGTSSGEHAWAKLVSCDSSLMILESLMSPKRLVMRGSNGKEYWWLVKGGEDLRQDERVQQVFRAMNQLRQILAVDTQCAQRRLQIATYQVVPVSKLVGMIEWVQGTTTLQDMVTQGRGNCKVPEDISTFFRPMDDLSKFLPYIEKNETAHTENFVKNIQEHIPSTFVRTALMSKAQSAQVEFDMRSRFALSLSASSCCIGDRHLSNLLVTVDTGAIVPIDFGHAFGTATTLLPLPELMPFRMTPQLLGVLAPLNAEGLLKRSMTYVMSALRSNKSVLIRTMDIFASDPTIDWTKHAVASSKASGSAKTASKSQGKTSEDSQAEAVQWYAEEKIKTVQDKLDGVHPATVMLNELAGSSRHANLAGKNGLKRLLEGNESSVRNAILKETQGKKLTPKQQVDCLVDQACDPAILSRTWRGWCPWY